MYLDTSPEVEASSEAYALRIRENVRCRTILQSSAGRALPELAAHLAFNTGMGRHGAVRFLQVAAGEDKAFAHLQPAAALLRDWQARQPAAEPVSASYGFAERALEVSARLRPGSTHEATGATGGRRQQRRRRMSQMRQRSENGDRGYA